jgi:hypothetical protein
MPILQRGVIDTLPRVAIHYPLAVDDSWYRRYDARPIPQAARLCDEEECQNAARGGGHNTMRTHVNP